MLLSLLLLLLLLPICSAQATSFYGTVMTYYPKNTYADGSVTVVLRYKLSFSTCQENALWTCGSGNCGNESSLVLNIVDQESSGEWCQREGIMTRQVPSNAPFHLVVPSNCERNFSLLAFDPDGDEVRCRSGLVTISSCILSFIPAANSFEGAYVQQLVMEDFPRQNITLTQTNGLQTIITPNEAISEIPVQFALRLDPVVPSCTAGIYLPKFLPPTPANRAQLYTSVNQTLEINISAKANVSTITELLFSGPHNIVQTTSGTGQYTLRWTPSEQEDGESHPICFVVQAVSNSTKYQSELRCVIVSVGNATILPTTTPVLTTNITIPTTQNTTITITMPTTTTPQTTTTDPPTTTPLTTSNITMPTTTTPQTTTTDPPTTTPLTTSNITMPTTTTPQTTTTDPPTTTPLTTSNITMPTTTTPQTTTTDPPTTTPLTTSNITMPTTTTPQTTTTDPPTTTPLTTSNITMPTTTTPQTTTTDPPTTTPLTTSNITMPTTFITPPTTTTIPATATPLTATITTTASPPPVPTPETTTAVPNISNQFVVILRVKFSSPSPLSEGYIIQQIRDELLRKGLSLNVIVRLLSIVQQ
ncbi:mucin-2 [Perca flavescens]|uniref:mucin-2 n=1 Tax=Perca flavescens TaxID=8167 RepID=UPI00106DE562|nr:mucin-2-like [Perca flavescens]